MLRIATLLLLVQLFPNLAQSQNIVFPATVVLEFSPSADHLTLSNYEVTLVGTPAGTPLITNVPLSACPSATATAICSFTFQIANMGPWTISLVAVGNALVWNNLKSAAVTQTFSARNPTPAGIIRIRLVTPN